MESPKRRLIQFRLTDDEWQNFQIRAIKANMNKAQYIKYLILSDDTRNFRMQKMRERIQELSGHPYDPEVA